MSWDGLLLYLTRKLSVGLFAYLSYCFHIFVVELILVLGAFDFKRTEEKKEKLAHPLVSFLRFLFSVSF